jgi:hypothetical protein
MFVCFDDAAIDAGALAKIVGINDEVLLPMHG